MAQGAAAPEYLEVRSSRLWAALRFRLTRFIFPTRMVADHVGISTKEVSFWLTPWVRTDDHLPLSHIAEVLHKRRLFWDAISVESSGGANPLEIAGVSKFSAGYFVEHVRERINQAAVQPGR